MPEVLQALTVRPTKLNDLQMVELPVIVSASHTNQLGNAVTLLLLHRTWARTVSKSSSSGEEN